jgi:hypothetical protein
MLEDDEIGIRSGCESCAVGSVDERKSK